MINVEPNCKSCPYKGRRVGWKGNPAAPLVVVGEGPGIQEIRQGKPFVGESGKLLHQHISNDDTVFITNAQMCMPAKHLKDMHTLAAASKACHNRLMAEINEHPRKLIVTLGNAATWSVTNDYNLRITKCRGFLIQDPSIAEIGILPVIHPAALLRGTGSYREFCEDIAYAKDLMNGGPIKVPREFERIEIDATNRAAAEEAVERLAQFKELTCDLETSGFSARDDYILTVGISTPDDEAYCFDPVHLPLLEPLFENREISWDYHGGKFDIQFLRDEGIQARVDEDTLLMSYALEENPGVHDLETVAKDVLGSPNWKDMLEQYLPKKGASYKHIPIPVLNEYMSYDTGNTRQIREIYRRRVAAQPILEKLYTKILIPASEMLARVETKGFYVDTERLEYNKVYYDEEIKKSVANICEIAGRSINPNSPQQMSDVLFRQFKLPNKRKGSTAKEVVALLPQVPIVKALTNHRKIAKAYSTYVKPVWGFIASDGRVHPNFLIHGTPTGRLACRKPNLQNIPRDPRLRGTFIAAPGRKLMEVDESQAELRSLACLSGDPDLCEIYLTEGASLHHEVALTMFGEGYNKDQYVRAKAVNFGIVYGRSAKTLADEFGIPVSEGQRMIDAWFERFPVAHAFIEACRRAPLSKATITTTFGRMKRHGVVSKNRLRDLMNEAANFPHQSIASDINLLAAIRVQPQLEAMDCWIVNLVHDSIIIECPDNEFILRRAAQLTSEAQQTIPLEWGLTRIPFVSDVEVGDRWGSLKEYSYA